MEDLQFALRFVGIAHPGHGQGTRIGELIEQQGDAPVLVEGKVIGTGPAHRQQFGDRARMYIRILAQVERRQMEPEQRHRTPNLRKRPPASCPAL